MSAVKKSLLAISVFTISAVGVSCGRRIVLSSVTGRGHNITQAPSTTVPSNAVKTVGQLDAKLIGSFNGATTYECLTATGELDGDPAQMLPGYKETLTISNSEIDLAGSFENCHYTIKLAVAGVTSSSFYVSMSAFQAFDGSTDVTSTVGTNQACQGVISDLSTSVGKNTFAIGYTFDGATGAIKLIYKPSEYCGEGDSERDSYTKS